MSWPGYWTLAALSTLTKYPSVPTFHEMGERGRLTDAIPLNFDGPEDWEAYEKIDGTNARIIFTAFGYFIGSREELLTFEHDVVRNPALGIVETVQPLLVGKPEVELAGRDDVLVVWGEVYGAKVGKNAKRYAATARTAFRAFDIALFSGDLFARLMREPLQELAAWRERGLQPFVTALEREAWLEKLGLEGAPLVARGLGPLPRQLEHTAFWLGQTAPPRTLCGLDASGPAEGLVLRNTARGKIFKLRVEDYARSVPQGRGLIDIAQETQK